MIIIFFDIRRQAARRFVVDLSYIHNGGGGYDGNKRRRLNFKIGAEKW